MSDTIYHHLGENWDVIFNIDDYYHVIEDYLEVDEEEYIEQMIDLLGRVYGTLAERTFQYVVVITSSVKTPREKIFVVIMLDKTGMTT